MTKIFNYRKFYTELNRQRRTRGNIAWNKVATRAGLAPSNIHTFVQQFENPDRPAPKALSLENVIKLMDWMNMTDLKPFIIEEDDPDATI